MWATKAAALHSYRYTRNQGLRARNLNGRSPVETLASSSAWVGSEEHQLRDAGAKVGVALDHERVSTARSAEFVRRIVEGGVDYQVSSPMARRVNITPTRGAR